MSGRVPRRRVDGVLLLDKPAGLSSNAALQRAKRLFAAEKAGHTGTLDPLATGLLPIAFGEATKFAQSLLDAPKAYEAVVASYADQQDLFDLGIEAFRLSRYCGSWVGVRIVTAVADGVAEGVIDLLEAVEIDEQQRHVAAGARLVVEKRRHCTDQLASIDQLGENVMSGEELQLVAGATRLGDVVELADEGGR